MKITYALLADYGVVTPDGKTTLVGVFTNIGTKAVPFRHPLLALAFQLEMRYAEVGRPHSLMIDMVNPDGEKVLPPLTTELTAQPAPGHQPKPGEIARFPHVTLVPNLEFKRTGHHDINFFVNGQLVHTLTFDIAQMPRRAKAA